MNDISREMPRTLKLATVWLLLGVLVFVGVQAWQSQQQRARFSVDAVSGAIELRRAADGHFHWPGTVNGIAVDFLVDTGATGTAIPQAPGWLKAGAAGIVLYLLSPVDLIPDVIPVLGVMDDIVLVPLAINWLLKRLPASLRRDIGAAGPAPAPWRSPQR